MKKNYLLFCLCILYIGLTPVYGQIDASKWMHGWTNFQPNLERYMEADTKIPSLISEDLVLSNNKIYLLSGNVYVVANAKLTIEPGTIIRCDHTNPASLIVSRGAKLIAEGTNFQPIVFTSNKPTKSRQTGDWGGIVILGNGKLNTVSGVANVEGNFSPQYSLYGGDTPEEETAILKYVRIEYPGRKINESKELNGLTLCGIGSKTILENIMVSYSADDSFEWFGGQGDFSNLISYKSKDDDFDITDGFKGSLTHILSVRHPYISDVSGSYAIEIDGYSSSGYQPIDTHLSFVKVKNATLINLANQESTPFIKAAISAKKKAQISVEYSSISGFAHVVKLDKSYTNSSEIVNSISFVNNFFNVSDQGLNSRKNTIYHPNGFFSSNIFTKDFKNPEDLYMAPLDDVSPSFTLKSSEMKNNLGENISLNH
ncbi:hypothetical protein Q4566_02480 [Tamlana sp. 2_MG-2023]|uniref:hypothetical protein n=1 Tax=unclassified Tamlana TaxID=2614803 RepID=UPI0026E29DFF|nr:MULTISPECIES: hypothetical protein [unclassified Tamlana]MDO6759054.1 hypothetical protein [Tamlana sp. 2_MG-2023]MDO6789753.1 hypothetical protein [Tamlana sp. 1_MG-2023]